MESRYRKEKDVSLRNKIVRGLLTFIILSIGSITLSCDALKPVFYKRSDLYFNNITKSNIYQPSVGGLDLLSYRQVMGMQYDWRNSYFLDINRFYYNPYFANYWWWDNQWRFNYRTYTQPIYSPRPLPRPRPRIAPQRQPRQRNRVYTPTRRGSTQQVTPRSNPNLRTNVQPRRQSTPNVRPSGSNNGRRNQNN